MQVRLVALVPVLGLLLTGCTGGGASASPDPTLEPLPSPTPTALEVPASAQATTPQGAAAFARYYLDVLGQANNSGQVEALARLHHPECGTCKEYVGAIEREVSEGKRFEGGEYAVRSAEATETAPGDAIVDVVFDRAASRTTDGSGRVDPGAAEMRRLMQLRLLRDEQSWLVRGIRLPEVPS